MPIRDDLLRGLPVCRTSNELANRRHKRAEELARQIASSLARPQLACRLTENEEQEAAEGELRVEAGEQEDEESSGRRENETEPASQPALVPICPPVRRPACLVV